MSKKPQDIPPFNPLDKTNLGESVADAVLEQPVAPLPPDADFLGAGVYALYYEGEHPLYREIAQQNSGGQWRWPIYVGKAVPAGARKGAYVLDKPVGRVLSRRLQEHATSIAQAQNLDVTDFRCRFLVVDDIWIPLAESLLIETYRPVWNQKIEGFGNHDPGQGRYNQKRSKWDTLHPGRPWAFKLKPSATDEDALREEALSYIRLTRAKIWPDM